MTSMQANFVINLGTNSQVPIISYSATSPSLYSLRGAYFIRATLDDSAQVKAISAIVQAFGWRAAVPVYADNEFGRGLVPFLTDALQEVATRVPYRSAIHPLACDDEIVAELYKLMTMQTRVFIVHMSPFLAHRLFSKAEEVGMMTEGFVWIVTTGITNELSLFEGPLATDLMQGVLGVKHHVPRGKRLQDFISRWRSKFHRKKPTNTDMNIFGLEAYDAATALAIAVERVGPIKSSFEKMNYSGNLTDLETLAVSQIGKDLQNSLSSIRFNGLSGDFHIVNGQLQSSAFQIVNFIGKGERGIGFWSSENGLVKDLDVNNTDAYLTSMAKIKAPIWPGDTTVIPKGWIMPTNEKKLRIGVPVKDGFSDFVNVTRIAKTSTAVVTGFCIEVFDAVMAALPYAVPYEYVPFATPQGKSAGSYDDLVYQVFLGKFDAVVGDVTITANRSMYVDFTIPYTESGVTMLVPVKDKNEKNAWIFLKPFTWDLWVTSACFFVFMGFMVWIFEREANEDFRGSLAHQLGTSFWFSFSIMFFIQREKFGSNLARFLVIIWCSVVLILTQTYTASLTSMLTVKQLEPTVTNIKELIEKGENIGYPKGSFVFELLKEMNMDVSKLKAYDTIDEMYAAFSSKSANERIAAAFDEIPYFKAFLVKHCSKYTMVGPTIKTAGFGFAFPKSSPLVVDISRAILNVTEMGKMVRIEKAWFGQKIICPELSSTTSVSSSGGLNLSTFRFLFVVVGLASSFALITFTSMLVFEHRRSLMQFDPKAFCKKMLLWCRCFKEREHKTTAKNVSEDDLSPSSPSTN